MSAHHTPSDGRLSPHTDADARLIAAAPDLLAALRDWIAQRDELGMSHCAVSDRARAAITKAIGAAA